MPATTAPVRLRAAVQHYHWGSTTLIPSLSGAPPSAEPMAELWFGTHERGNTLAEWPGQRDPVSLRQAIARCPRWWLGDDRRELPFLLKVLAAERPLSIQVHPSRQQASEGFEREEEAGVPLDAPGRSYRDRSDKPEILRALSPFIALYGFRPRALIREALALLGLAADLPGDTVKEMVTHLALLDHQQRKRLAARAVEAAPRLRNDPDWNLACYWIQRLAGEYPDDPWVLAPILLQLVELEPGEALFTEAGVPHAYLSGLGVELMNSSDNVLRAGLTSKKVDAAELIRVFDSRAVHPRKLHPLPVDGSSPESSEPSSGARVGRYRTPTRSFELLEISPSADAPVDLCDLKPEEAPAMVLCTSGTLRVGSGSSALELKPPEAAFIPASASSCPIAGRGFGFLATIPA